MHLSTALIVWGFPSHPREACGKIKYEEDISSQLILHLKFFILAFLQIIWIFKYGFYNIKWLSGSECFFFKKLTFFPIQFHNEFPWMKSTLIFLFLHNETLETRKYIIFKIALKHLYSDLLPILTCLKLSSTAQRFYWKTIGELISWHAVNSVVWILLSLVQQKENYMIFPFLSTIPITSFVYYSLSWQKFSFKGCQILMRI